MVICGFCQVPGVQAQLEAREQRQCCSYGLHAALCLEWNGFVWSQTTAKHLLRFVIIYRLLGLKWTYSWYSSYLSIIHSFSLFLSLLMDCWPDTYDPYVFLTLSTDLLVSAVCLIIGTIRLHALVLGITAPLGHHVELVPVVHGTAVSRWLMRHLIRERWMRSSRDSLVSKYTTILLLFKGYELVQDVAVMRLELRDSWVHSQLLLGDLLSLSLVEASNTLVQRVQGWLIKIGTLMLLEITDLTVHWVPELVDSLSVGILKSSRKIVE